MCELCVILHYCSHTVFSIQSLPVPCTAYACGYSLLMFAAMLGPAHRLRLLLMYCLAL